MRELHLTVPQATRRKMREQRVQSRERKRKRVVASENRASEQQFVRVSQSKRNIHHVTEKEIDNVLHMTLTNLRVLL